MNRERYLKDGTGRIRCTRCMKPKHPTADFYRRKDGPMSWCKVCARTARNMHYHANVAQSAEYQSRPEVQARRRRYDAGRRVTDARKADRIRHDAQPLAKLRSQRAKAKHLMGRHSVPAMVVHYAARMVLIDAEIARLTAPARVAAAEMAKSDAEIDREMLDRVRRRFADPPGRVVNPYKPYVTEGGRA